MTRDKAKKLLTWVKENLVIAEEYKEAIDMVIEAIQNEDREDYELATEQMEHDAMYEPTYNSEDGSM